MRGRGKGRIRQWGEGGMRGGERNEESRGDGRTEG